MPLWAGLVGLVLLSGCGDVAIDDLLSSFNLQFVDEPSGGRELPSDSPLWISPARGSVLGGTRVTIVGLNTPPFEPGTDVLFGGFPVADLEIVDNTTILVTAPPQASGQVDVTLRVADQTVVTATAGFEYIATKDADAEILSQIEAMFPGAPHLVSAVATSNTSARVTFSEPVGEGALDALNYFIVIGGGGVLKLDLSKAIEQSEDGTVVDLPTLSQAGALYEMTVTAIHDLAGNPMAPPDLLDTPAFTTFTGIPPGSVAEQIDSDGDGLADWFELLGWPITIELADGQRVQSYVTSNPFNPDTDGDGVGDAEENARSMHPRSNDTDADLVLDADEIWGWRSNPNDQDTDDDGFSDMEEVGFGTSLILADTDGDQLDDRDELLNRNRNPHIADLPIVDIVVGEINLQLDQRYTYTDQFGQEQQIQQSFSSTLQRDTSSSLSVTTSDVTRSHFDQKFTYGLQVTGQVGGGVHTGGFVNVQLSAGGETSFGNAQEHSTVTTNQSSVSTAKTYNEAINRVSQISSTSGVSREIVAALLSASVTIGAASDIAFQISDIEISVLMQDPQDRSRVVPIATLVPSEPDAVYSLGPLVPEVGPLIFENTDIFPSLVENLMKDPRGLLIKLVNYNITDEFERNFAFTSQEVVERTAILTIDFGNGESETHRIATAGRFDLQGQPLGISMADALAAIGLLPWEGEDPELGDADDPTDTRPKRTDADILGSFGMTTVSLTGADGEPVDVRAISRVRGVQDDFDLATVEPNKPNDGGFWVVFVTGLDGPNADPDAPTLQGTTDFDEARLHAGEAYIFAFVKDKDQDNITSLEEFFSGSSDTSSDSDSDDLGDYLEIRGQWDLDGLGAWFVSTDVLPGGYRAYSAPYMSDSDDDGLTDDREYALCRYAYDENGDPLVTAFAIGSYPDDLTNPPDDQVAWDNGLTPADLPDLFACEGLPEEWLTDVDEETGEPILHQWHTELDSQTGMPTHFPTNWASLDPRKMDTDEDGISDADEVNGFYLDLFDEDPLGDSVRTRVFVRTDPLRADTDGDGLIDGMELQFGTHPARSDSGAVFDDDLDGLSNRVEETGWEITVNGALQCVHSDPDDPDSDNDGLPDYVEWVLGTNPWDAIGQTPDPNLAAPGYDTDGDGLSDREEWDGLVPSQDQEKLAFCDLVPNCAGYTSSDVAHNTDPIDDDTDDDDLSDGDELIGWTVRLSGSTAGYPVFSDPLVPDTDFDGSNDGDEFVHGTDPHNADTDGDGLADPVEVTRVADPMCRGLAENAELECVGEDIPCEFDSDCNGATRDPLTPDQRITVRYNDLCVSDDGAQADERTFAFAFGLEMPANLLSESWVTHNELISGMGLSACPPGACTQNCTCTSFIRACSNGLCPDLGAQEASTTRSFIMAEGDIFWLKGSLLQFYSCDNLDQIHSVQFGFGDDITVPTNSQSFTFTDAGVNSEGDLIVIEVQGFIAVD